MNHLQLHFGTVQSAVKKKQELSTNLLRKVLPIGVDIEEACSSLICPAGFIVDGMSSARLNEHMICPVIPDCMPEDSL
jgi:hypothetical protein